MIRDAFPKGNQRHRDWLTRIWDETKPMLLVIGRNPSRGTDTEDDRLITDVCWTIRDNHPEYGGIVLVNVVTVRAANQAEFEKIKPQEYFFSGERDNLDTIIKFCSKCKGVVFAFGLFCKLNDYERSKNYVFNTVTTRFSKEQVFVFGVNGMPYVFNQDNKNRGLVDGKLHQFRN